MFATGSSWIYRTAAILAVFGSFAQAQTTNGGVASEDFKNLCSPCHGLSAKGDGLAGHGLTKRPADLTTISIRHGGTFPETLITETIGGLDMPVAHGTRDMPIWGEVFISDAVGSSVTIEAAKKATSEVEQRISRLVKYLQSIQTTK